jgi:hypothetical protein
VQSSEFKFRLMIGECVRKCGAGARADILALIFVIAFGAHSSVWAQQPAPNAGASPSPDAAAAPASPAPTDTEAKREDAGKSAGPHPSLTPGFDPTKGVPLYETIQEDWNSLQIGVSHLTPLPPLVAQTDEGPGFTRTLVQLQWRPGDPLDLYVILPKGTKKPPAVLYLYGYKEDTDRFKNDQWCQRVTSGGFAAIGFVSALSGHRFHDRPMRQWFVSELQESVGSTVHDVKFILDYLAQRADVDMSRIGMFGQASGGAIAILAAAADPRIKAVDVLDPWGDWPVWLDKSWIAKEDPDHAAFTDPEFLKRVAPLDPVKWLPALSSRRIRIQQVMDNSATPDECKDAIRKAAPKRAEVVRWDHVGQFSDASSHGQLFAWVKVQLKALHTPPQQKRVSVAQRVAAGLGKTASNNGTSLGTQR